MTDAELDQLAINTIRTLSIDAVQAAKLRSPRPRRWRLPPLVYTLWNRVMRFDPAGPDLARPRPLRAVERPRVRCCCGRCLYLTGTKAVNAEYEAFG